MARLRREHMIVTQEMVARDVPVRQIARDLGVDESTVRYHVARGTHAPDGRRDRPSIMDDWQERVTSVLQRFDDPRTGGAAETAVEAAVVHGVLRREFGFTGSYRAVRRYLVRQYPAAPIQAVRRVETPRAYKRSTTGLIPWCAWRVWRCRSTAYSGRCRTRAPASCG